MGDAVNHAPHHGRADIAVTQRPTLTSPQVLALLDRMTPAERERLFAEYFAVKRAMAKETA